MLQEQRYVNRRTFLQTSAAVMGASAVAPALLGSALAADADWKMRLSTSSIQFGTLPVEKACERIASLGFEAIDFWPTGPVGLGCPHLEEIDKRLGPAGLQDLLAKNRLKLCALTCYFVGYPKYAKLLGSLGGGVAVRDSRPGNPANLRAEMKDFFERLKPEIELAEKYDSYLAIENHGNCLLGSHDAFKAFVEMNPSRRVGVALAPWHLQAAGISVTDVIATVGKQLFFFYAWQHAEGVSQLPGIGSTDCTPWLTALAKIGYPRYVNPFMHGHPQPTEMTAALATSRKYMMQCYEKAFPGMAKAS
jgi:sugar phosphate isomerase/epimerase